MTLREQDGHAILMIDGVCNLCNGVVRFAVAREAGDDLRFTNLQSAVGQKLIETYGIAEEFDTVVLIENGRVYDRSTAALHILRYLNFPWPLLYPLIVVPGFIRDRVYDFVARNRYRWFGKMDTCPIPSPELRERFLA